MPGCVIPASKPSLFSELCHPTSDINLKARNPSPDTKIRKTADGAAPASARRGGAGCVKVYLGGRPCRTSTIKGVREGVGPIVCIAKELH